MSLGKVKNKRAKTSWVALTWRFAWIRKCVSFAVRLSAEITGMLMPVLFCVYVHIYIHIYACLYTCAICIWIADESLVAAANKNNFNSCKQQSLCCTHPFGAVVRTQQPVSKFNSWPSPPIQAVSKWDNAVQVQRSISPLERALMHSSIDALRRENDERHKSAESGWSELRFINDRSRDSWVVRAFSSV